MVLERALRRGASPRAPHLGRGYCGAGAQPSGVVGLGWLRPRDGRRTPGAPSCDGVDGVPGAPRSATAVGDAGCAVAGGRVGGRAFRLGSGPGGAIVRAVDSRARRGTVRTAGMGNFPAWPAPPAYSGPRRALWGPEHTLAPAGPNSHPPPAVDRARASCRHPALNSTCWITRRRQLDHTRSQIPRVQPIIPRCRCEVSAEVARHDGVGQEAGDHDGSARPSELQVPQAQVGHVLSFRHRLPSVPWMKTTVPPAFVALATGVPIVKPPSEAHSDHAQLAQVCSRYHMPLSLPRAKRAKPPAVVVITDGLLVV